MQLKGLYERKGEIKERIDSIADQANREGRDLTDLEKRRIDSFFDEAERLNDEISKHGGELRENPNKQRVGREPSVNRMIGESNYATRAFDNYIRYGEWESRALGSSSGSGVMVPEEFNDQFVEVLKQTGSIFRVANVISTETNGGFPVPSVDNTGNSGSVVGENTQITSTSDPTVNDKTLSAYIYASDIYKVSRQLARSASFDLGNYLIRAVAESVNRKANADLTNGNGSSKATGIMDATNGASDSGVETSSNSAITYSELLDLYHSVDPLYRHRGDEPVGVWMMSDSALKVVRQVTDSNNRPLFIETSNGQGFNGSLFGHPVVVNNDMDDYAASNKPIIFGDIANRYWIRRVDSMEVLRLEEKYADYLQIGFIGYVELDGILTDTNAVKYLSTPA